MRPASLEDGEEENLKIIAIGLAIVVISVITAGILIFGGTGGSNKQDGISFSEIRLQDKEIEEGSKTYLYVKVGNYGGEDFENIEIRLSSPSSSVNLSYKIDPGENEYLTESDFRSDEDDEYFLIESIPPLWAGKDMGERSKLYAFGVEGSLEPGTTRKAVQVKVQVIADGTTADEKVFELTIEKE